MPRAALGRPDISKLTVAMLNPHPTPGTGPGTPTLHPSLVAHRQNSILDFAPRAGARDPQGGRNRAPRAWGKLGFSKGAPTKWSLDRQAEVGDHVGHPKGVQVKTLNLE